MNAIRYVFRVLPLFFMVLAIVFGSAVMIQGGWRLLHGLPVVCDR